jgi:hypothetical protein
MEHFELAVLSLWDPFIGFSFAHLPLQGIKYNVS